MNIRGVWLVCRLLGDGTLESRHISRGGERRLEENGSVVVLLDEIR